MATYQKFNSMFFRRILLQRHKNLFNHAAAVEDTMRVTQGGSVHNKRTALHRKVMGSLDPMFSGIPADQAPADRNLNAKSYTYYTEWHKELHRINGLIDPPWLKLEPFLDPHAKDILERGGKRLSQLERPLQDKLLEDLNVLSAANALKLYTPGVCYLNLMIRRREMNFKCAMQAAKLLWTAMSDRTTGRALVESSAKGLLSLAKLPRDTNKIDQTVLELLLKSVLKNHWKSAVAIFKNNPHLQDHNSQCAPAIISAAFRNETPSLALKLLNDFYPEDKVLDIESRCYLAVVFQSWIQYCIDTYQMDYNALADIMQAIQARGLCINLQMLKLLQHYCKLIKHHFKSDMISVSFIPHKCKNRVCPHCAEALELTEMTPQQSQTILTTIEAMIATANITNPAHAVDFDKLKTLLSERKFKVVVDGLNCFAYAIMNYHPDDRCYHPDKIKLAIESICETFSCSADEILVVFKLHDYDDQEFNLPPLYRDLTALPVHTFLAEDYVNDDLLILYAAISSGCDSFLMSKDHFVHLLNALPDDHIRKVFYQFQITRQSYIKASHNFKPEFQIPFGCDVNMQRTRRGWHIPISDGNATHFYCTPAFWFCIAMPEDNSQTQTTRNTNSS